MNLWDIRSWSMIWPAKSVRTRWLVKLLPDIYLGIHLSLADLVSSMSLTGTYMSNSVR
jgi:hypothetical protein